MSENSEAPVKTSPVGSVERNCLERVFDRFPFTHYLQTLELLAGQDWGRDARIELTYSSILYNYDPDLERSVAMVQAECELQAVFSRPYADWTFPPCVASAFWSRRPLTELGGVAPWVLVPYEHEGSARRFQRKSRGPDEEWPL